MQKFCKQCDVSFEVTDDDLLFLDKISPSFAGKKYLIPAPDFCASCRLQRRMLFRNERSLYKRKCDGTGKSILAAFPEDSKYKVHEHDYWWSDKWDAINYGKDFDFNKTLTEQLNALVIEVPHINLNSIGCENSDYVNYFINSKNSYLTFGGAHNEDCMYSKFLNHSKNILDGLSLSACEFCYEGNFSEGCYSCRYFVNCRNCSECTLIEECQGCKNCMACFGLKNKEYYVLNKFVGKEEFQKFADYCKIMSRSKLKELKEKLANLKKDLPHVQSHIYASEDSTGDMILNSKNCKNCFDIKECENCENMNFAPKSVNSKDACYSAPGPMSFGYQLCSTIGMENSMANFYTWYGGGNLYYCLECMTCTDCFACVGLRNKQYCVLNKQYTKEEYEDLVGKIIEKFKEWGQFLDPELSFFAYNETVAQEHFPLTKEQALKLGFSWRDNEEKQYQASNYPIPELITEVGDDILGEIFACQDCAKNYKILAEELKFYKLMGVPIPLKCHNCRHSDRMDLRRFFKLYTRECAKCSAKIKTIYSPDRSEIVYCHQCYLNET
ncbi:MAG: hypothetical protein AAB373_03385 [Patescibacteria group bacterium]